MTKKMRSWAPALTLLLSSACAHDDLTDTGEPTELQLVHYAIPAQVPTGTVDVMPVGFVSLPASGGRPTSVYWHVRIGVRNQKDVRLWTMVAGEQTAGDERIDCVPPAFARTRRGTDTLSVATQQHDTLDLFFPLHREQPPDVLVLRWKLRRGRDQTILRTAFKWYGDEPPLYVVDPAWPEPYGLRAPAPNWLAGDLTSWWDTPDWTHRMPLASARKSERSEVNSRANWRAGPSVPHVPRHRQVWNAEPAETPHRRDERPPPRQEESQPRGGDSGGSAIGRSWRSKR